MKFGEEKLEDVSVGRSVRICPVKGREIGP